MLFNSYIFIFVYMPLTLAVFFALGRANQQQWATAWLVLMSLVFYGWWNPIYLILMCGSMIFNFQVGVALGRRRGDAAGARRLLAFGVVADLLLLGYFKYANFFVDNWNALAGTSFTLETILLPLGISFFTFTQIAYLVDAYRGEAREYSPLHYALFVTYFPHLIAGPVLHHKEMMPQFAKPSIYRPDITCLMSGSVYFLMGLFKKVVIADGISGYASPVFDAAAAGSTLTTFDAWSGALAYSFQLYFDFSGYSDMAVGLALMMGVRLPLNFNSPYKAINIIDFWRRWHMTLSRFLRDYLYFALGGNRAGPARRYVNLFLTMLLGGLWHGAGWTFIVWGALHGTYLMINHAWRALLRALGWTDRNPTIAGRVLGTALTFLAVVVGWVFFRAADMPTALRMLDSMFIQTSFELSAPYSEVIEKSDIAKWFSLGGVALSSEALLLAVHFLLLFILMAWPNTQELLCNYYHKPEPSLENPRPIGRIQWRPNFAWSVIIALAGTWAILGLSSVSEFLYFQF
jgi:alginate O-acetyltransferase complex protein AlgI